MKPYLLAAALATLGLSGCITTEPDRCQTTMLAPVLSATGPKMGAVNTPAVFTLTYQAANGCGTLGNLPEQVNAGGTTRVVGVNVQYSTCTCATPATTGQATYTLQPTQAGTYYLQFVAASGYVSDTLVVK